MSIILMVLGIILTGILTWLAITWQSAIIILVMFTIPVFCAGLYNFLEVRSKLRGLEELRKAEQQSRV
jgi:hypothetical protein